MQKTTDHFDDFLDPPVRMAKLESNSPAVRGMRLPEATVRLMDGTARIVEDHSDEANRQLAYPAVLI